VSPPSSGVTGVVLVWALGTFFSATSLLFYTMLSKHPMLERLSEHPEAAVGLWAVSLGAGGWGTYRALTSPESFPGPLRRSMWVGTLVGAWVVALSITYIYSYSSHLPGFERAPRPGEQAPGLEVVTPEGRTWSLHEKPLRGRAILLVFYRGNW